MPRGRDRNVAHRMRDRSRSRLILLIDRLRPVRKRLFFVFYDDHSASDGYNEHNSTCYNARQSVDTDVDNNIRRRHIRRRHTRRRHTRHNKPSGYVSFDTFYACHGILGLAGREDL
ncbi:hypothetical protein JAO29_10225 [Edaphobacter sp. HDX4]|uniref:hypothetical protein n=1 Tax=Edaphobacter sp. HDX4 TaxID=2794064 RepID=UPI002FE5CA2B